MARIPQYPDHISKKHDNKFIILTQFEGQEYVYRYAYPTDKWAINCIINGEQRKWDEAPSPRMYYPYRPDIKFKQSAQKYYEVVR